MKTRSLALILSLFCLIITTTRAQVTKSQPAAIENSIVAQYGFDAAQKQTYNLLKADVKLKIEALEPTIESNPIEYYEKRAEIIYDAKMQLKQLLTPEQRRIWREREEALHNYLLEQKATLKSQGKSDIEVLESLAKFNSI